MAKTKKITSNDHNKKVLSFLWIFIMFNYLYCDLFSLMDSSHLKQYLSGMINGIPVTSNFLLVASILMEIPMIMILVSRFVGDFKNRVANVIAASFMTLVQIGSLTIPGTTKYYLFFSVVEIATLVFIVYYAIKWPRYGKN